MENKELQGFENKKLEFQFLKYVLTVNPYISSNVDKKILSTVPLRDIFDVVKKLKCTLTDELLLFELKKCETFSAEKNLDSILGIYTHYISEIFNSDITGLTSKNIAVAIDVLYELSDKRYLFRLIKKWVESPDKMEIPKVKKLLRKFAREGIDRLDTLSGDYLEDYENRKEFIVGKTSDKINCIPTGINKFDWQIGGLMLGEFGVLAGRTGLGKTAMLVCIAVNAWLKGFNVFFATGEMKKILIQFRMDSNLTGISGQKFRTGEFDENDFMLWGNKINELREKLDSFLEVESFSRNFNCDQLEDRMHRVQDKQGKAIDLILTDYINIMSSNDSKGGKQEWQSQSNSVWDFKTLVETFNNGKIAGWTAGQIKDEFFDASKLTLDSIKYARAISETAPVICGLVRTEDDILFNQMQVQILKMRNAEPIKEPIILYPDLEVMRINNNAEIVLKSLDDVND